MKYRYYLKHTTRRAIASFARNLPKMGNIVRIQGEYSIKRWYRVRFYNDAGQQFVFRGFAWFYSGEGPRGLQACLRMLGVPESVIAEFVNHQHHGDNYSPNGFLLTKGVSF